MPDLTRFMVQSYFRTEDGILRADEPVRCYSPEEAVAEANKLFQNKEGVVAYKWVGEMRHHDRGKINLLLLVGEIPVYAAAALDVDL